MKRWSLYRHRGEGMVLSLPLLLAVLCCSALGQLGQVNMRQVTESLGQRFEEIKRYGLGVEALQAEYLRVGFTFSRLEQTDITDLLSDTRARETINSILSLFEDITSDNVSSSTPLEVQPTTDCCEIDLTGQSNPQACCHGCTSADSDTVTAIAEGFRGADLEGVELEFGSSSGTLLKFPASTPEQSCSKEDARLQPWYTDITRSRPREIVILLDLTTSSNTPVITSDDLQNLRRATQEFLTSLTAQDRAGVVAISGPTATTAPVNSLIGVVPVCETNRNELSNFINSVSSGDTPGNYTFGFTLAFRQLSNDSNSDKLILFFTTGGDIYGTLDVTLVRDRMPILEVVTHSNSKRTLNTTIISVFRFMESSTATDFFNDLVNQPMVPAGTITTLDTENAVATYYSPLLSNCSASEILLARQINNNGENSLSISQVWCNGSTLVGVLHAVIPWQQLFGYIDPYLENRDSSYVLVFTGEGQALLHPLLPGNIQSTVHVSDVETEGDINTVLNMLMNQPSVTHQFQKQILISTGSRDPSGFIQRTVPATYHCRDLRITGIQLCLCLVVAEEDVVTVKHMTEDPRDVYQGGRQAPIYHNTALSVLEEDQCNYFCKLSVSDQISFQLTNPNRPPDEDTLSQVQEITMYIEEGGTPPSWITTTSVASDVAINSIVAESWMNMTGEFNDYISRRHLVTPSGVYLSYPPSQLNREFQPELTEWFASSSAHTSILTLTPPRTDSLMEGGQVYSLGYALRAPQDQSDMDLGDEGQLLSVVAADATLSSLRTMLLDILPLCEQSEFSCFLIDDRGNLVYHPDLLEGEYEGGPIFFTAELVFRSLTQNNIVFFEHYPILTDLLVKRLSSKLQCVDHFDGDIRQRRFFSFDFTSDLTYSNLGDTESCVHYMLRHIPGTNAFFGITQMIRDCSGGICFCVPACFNCDTIPGTGCECPCTCNEDCLVPRGIPPCPMVSTEDANYNAVLSEDSTDLPYCFNQSCGCREDLQSCVGVRECYWCESEERCVHNTECCSSASDANCCATEDRFSSLPFCLQEACSQGVVPPDNSVCPTETPFSTPTSSSSSDNDTAVIAGVVGGLVGLILILLLGGFIVWYQFFRAADPDEDISKESAFDFSNKRHEAVNPTAIASNEDVLGEENVRDGIKGGSSKPDETTL